MAIMSNEEVMGLLKIGEGAEFQKTVGESDVYLFAGITGDLSPNHCNEEYCKKLPIGSRIAHGALTIGYISATVTNLASRIIAPGSPGGVVSRYDIKFVKPVRIGDTITVKLVVCQHNIDRREIVVDSKVFNQNDDLCAAGLSYIRILKGE